MSSQSPGIGSALPDMNANTSAMVLTNDGVMASWEVVTSLGLPPMGGNSGKYLTTNGTAASWGAVTADGILPSQTGNNGKVLVTNGTTATWGTVTGAGVDTMAAVGSSPNANGATIASTTLTLEPADGSNPGVVTTGSQTIAGVKTFSSVPVAAGISAPTTSGFTLAGNVTTGSSAVGVTIDNLVALTTAGAKIVSFQNHEAEKASVDKDGVVISPRFAVNVGAGEAVSLGAPGTSYGLWLYPSSGTAMTDSNFSFAGFNDGSLYIQAYTGNINFLSNTATIASVQPTNLDLTGMGTGGAIKIKDAGGTTRTLTITVGGAWSIV